MVSLSSLPPPLSGPGSVGVGGGYAPEHGRAFFETYAGCLLGARPLAAAGGLHQRGLCKLHMGSLPHPCLPCLHVHTRAGTDPAGIDLRCPLYPIAPCLTPCRWHQLSGPHAQLCLSASLLALGEPCMQGPLESGVLHRTDEVEPGW